MNFQTARATSVVCHMAIYLVVWLILNTHGADTTTFLISMALFILFIWISVIDFESFRIPDTASFTLAVTGLISTFVGPPDHAVNHIVAGALWPIIFFSLSAAYLRLRGRDGLGMGDAKLMCGVGLVVGLTGSILVVMTASFAAILSILVRQLVVKRTIFETKLTAVAFGPYLCLSAWAFWLSGDLHAI